MAALGSRDGVGSRVAMVHDGMSFGHGIHCGCEQFISTKKVDTDLFFFVLFSQPKEVCLV